MLDYIKNLFSKTIVVYDGVYKLADDGTYCPKGKKPTFMPHGIVADGVKYDQFYSGATDEEVLEAFLTREVTSLVGVVMWDSNFVEFAIKPSQLLCRVWKGKEYPVGTSGAGLHNY